MKNLTLEISFKAFYGLDSSLTSALCRRALKQWQPLIQHADRVSILFWASDGSEILEYNGDLDSEMEWARYFGNSNPHLSFPTDPERKSLHSRSYLYRPDAGLITYRRMAEIASAWREAMREYNLPCQIGLGFDPGGEFAPSDFKYNRHREICLANTMGKASFVCCYGILNGDTHPYAGFPEGIPDGTSFGTFLGRQFRHLAADAGLDFIWFSNGFAFGMENWKTVGPLFDGENFFPEKAPETRDKILNFWRDFRKECPDLGIATRGTNLGTSTDLASDATPLRELYEGGFDFAPPPNSPWAAINGDFGIELAGYLSRIAELPPGCGIPFRFYIHDPWWLNSPWLDRYERQPHDIYLPLSSGRVTSEGRTEGAETLGLLSLDDSHGRMPDTVPNEVIPHIRRAWECLPDKPAPLVWLYPFDEVHDAMFLEPRRPERLFHNDWFVREAINAGLPVNTVISTRSFDALKSRRDEVLNGRILLSPTPFNESMEERLLSWVDAGGDLMLYGPLRTAPRLREKLGMDLADPLEGRFEVAVDLPALDDFGDVKLGTGFEHRSLMSAGPLEEVPASGHTAAAFAIQNGERRALASVLKTSAGGQIAWLRGPLPLAILPDSHLPVPEENTFPLASLAREMLMCFGWKIGFHTDGRLPRLPVLTIHRHDNAWFFSGYLPDSTVEPRFQTPFGAPAFLGTESLVKNGSTAYRLARAWQHECRIFVEQESGWLSHVEPHPAQFGVTRRLKIQGLENAILRFFPPLDAGEVTAWHNMEWPFIGGVTLPLVRRETPHGPLLETASRVTGSILLSW